MKPNQINCRWCCDAAPLGVGLLVALDDGDAVEPVGPQTAVRPQSPRVLDGCEPFDLLDAEVLVAVPAAAEDLTVDLLNRLNHVAPRARRRFIQDRKFLSIIHHNGHGVTVTVRMRGSRSDNLHTSGNDG